jgi:uncharacterized membrane protein
MHLYLVVLRILHITGGVYWVGTILFLNFYVFPAVRNSGPDGGKIMQAITSTNKFAIVLSLVAIVTLLSGLLLLYQLSGGFAAEWFSSRYGMLLSIGGLTAIVAFVQGILINKPSVERIGAIGKQIQIRGGLPTETEKAEMLSLRERIFLSTKWLSLWLTITVVTMAIARYL